LPTPYKGRLPRLSESTLDEIRLTINVFPDITLIELIENLSLPIKKSQLSKLLIKLGFSFKRRLFIRKSNSGEMFNRKVSNGKKRKVH